MSNSVKSKRKGRARKRGRQYIGREILRLLSAVAQTLDTLGDFTYNPYPYLYASLGDVYDKETINEAVGSLLEKRLVEGSQVEGLRLAPAGTDVRKSLYQARRKDWDGQWRVVIFDVPEAQRKIRDDLRFELKKLGFGSWQKSVWVTPFDIARELSLYLQKQNLSKVVQIIVGKRCGGSSDRDFAAKVWPLNALNEKYVALLADWREELRRETMAKERLHAAAVHHSRYLDILVQDPQLPVELLPQGWVGDTARQLFKKLRSILTVSKPF